MNCDKCGKNLDFYESWVSWYWNPKTRHTVAVFITCHPSECPAAALIDSECPEPYELMDHEAGHVWLQLIPWIGNFKIPRSDYERLNSFALSDSRK